MFEKTTKIIGVILSISGSAFIGYMMSYIFGVWVGLVSALISAFVLYGGWDYQINKINAMKNLSK